MSWDENAAGGNVVHHLDIMTKNMEAGKEDIVYALMLFAKYVIKEQNWISGIFWKIKCFKY